MVDVVRSFQSLKVVKATKLRWMETVRIYPQ